MSYIELFTMNQISFQIEEHSRPILSIIAIVHLVVHNKNELDAKVVSNHRLSVYGYNNRCYTVRTSTECH